MKGIILAGGTGSRLAPCTKIINKHLLPVWNKPMIYYPIQMLVEAGIKEICIVTGGESSNGFLPLLQNGEEFGITNLQYAYQVGSGGIAAALKLTERFADGEKICVVLGDNIIEKDIIQAVKDFTQQEKGAKVMLKEVPDPQRFGVAELEYNFHYQDGIMTQTSHRILSIEEKPKEPKSKMAVTGIYFYDSSVFDKARELKPSARGELEITDINTAYLKEETLTASFIDGWWSDAGTHESLLRSSVLVAKKYGMSYGMPSGI
jgi:glucose-1-phosphate thymidylyltransferase